MPPLVLVFTAGSSKTVKIPAAAAPTSVVPVPRDPSARDPSAPWAIKTTESLTSEGVTKTMPRKKLAETDNECVLVDKSGAVENFCFNANANVFSSPEPASPEVPPATHKSVPAQHVGSVPTPTSFTSAVSPLPVEQDVSESRKQKQDDTTKEVSGERGIATTAAVD